MPQLQPSRYPPASLMTLQTALGFLLTVGTVQALPVVAAAVGWTWTLALMGVGPVLGADAMRRLMTLRAGSRETLRLSHSTACNSLWRVFEMAPDRRKLMTPTFVYHRQHWSRAVPKTTHASGCRAEDTGPSCSR